MKKVQMTLYAAFLLFLSVNLFCADKPSQFNDYDKVTIAECQGQETAVVRRKSYDATRDAWLGGIVKNGFWMLDNYGQDFGNKKCSIGSDVKSVDRWSTVADEVIQLEDKEKARDLLQALEKKNLKLHEDRMMKLNLLFAMVKAEPATNNELVSAKTNKKHKNLTEPKEKTIDLYNLSDQDLKELFPKLSQSSRKKVVKVGNKMNFQSKKNKVDSIYS